MRIRRKRNPLVIIGIMTFVGIVAGIFFWTFRFGIGGSEEDDLPNLLPPGNTLNQVVTHDPNEDLSFYPTLQIPAAGVNAVIVSAALQADGWDVRVLGDRIGHLAYTSWLGDNGNIVLAGHVEMANGSPGVFAGINRMKQGDLVTILEAGEEYVYAVTSVGEVDAQDMSVIYANGKDQITLITCTDYNFIAGDYGERIVVVAERVS